MAEHVLDRAAVGQLFEPAVTARTIAAYQARYAESHPFPEPAGKVGRSPYWLESQREAIIKWDEGRPGRGIGGGRPPKADPAS